MRTAIITDSNSGIFEREGWETYVKEAFPGHTVKYDPLTFSIACHVGPDAFGMGISRKINGK